VNHGSHHVSHRSHHVSLRPAVRRETVFCRNDRQRLWNGYHVRVFVDRIWVCNAAGDRLLQGDEVILLPNGYYKVRNGAFWRVYTPRCESVFEIWGDIVDLMADGLFRCYRAGMYFYYDELGNRVQ